MGKKIAILCMSLEIGGAETHIFELAKELKKKGHTVTVFSNGGVYADALEKAGVRHVHAPLHTKTLSSLRKSYKILMAEFKKNRPSVVHSHTRISSYVGGLVCKRLGIPMVTTVHGKFRSDFLFRSFSNWGCRALTVSEDLKNYLIDDYHYNPDHISMTVNGIDMKRFQKKDLPAFRAALGVAPQQKVILMVSRLDPDVVPHVQRVLNLAPDIFRQAPDTRLVIVGSGKSFLALAQEANRINQLCGTDFVLLQGAKTNVEQYTAVADLFIGISRSALEAMSSEVPVILLGNMGYLGLYSEEIRMQSVETNLTCRGFPFPDKQDLLQLILDCLKKQDLTANIQDGLRLVHEKYSIATMASTAEAVYREAVDAFRPLDYMISGYYGRNNFGDNLTLSCLMHHLKEKNGTVLTCNASSTRIPASVHKLHRFHLLKIRKAMKKTKVFLLGSGSILQDATSNRSIFYYHFIMRMAVRYHCKTMLYANGIGPIHRPINQRTTAKLLNQMDLITVRDQESIEQLRKFKVHTPVFLTADDSFSYDRNDLPSLPKDPNTAGKTIVGVNFISKLMSMPGAVTEIAAALSSLAETHSFFYNLIPLHLDQDTFILQELHRLLPKCSRLIQPTGDPEELIAVIAAGHYHIFERLHGQIISTTLNIPFLPIQYDPKNRSFSALVGIGSFLLTNRDLQRDTIIAHFESVLKHQDEIREKLITYTENAREKALENRQYLLQLIKDY